MRSVCKHAGTLERFRAVFAGEIEYAQERAQSQGPTFGLNGSRECCAGLAKSRNSRDELFNLRRRLFRQVGINRVVTVGLP